MNFRQKFQQHQKEIEQNAKQNFVRPDYVFHDNFHKQISCETSYDSIGRLYHVPSGDKLHSVTTVIGATKSEKDKKSLERWKKRVGDEEAERIKNNAAERGSFMHDSCENFILGNGKFEVAEYGTNNYSLFRQIHPLLLRINNIHNLEGVLYSEKLGLAGRVDCVAEFDGVLSIIDFKTATKVREEYMLQDYYTQETAYAVMFSEMYNTKINQIVTLMSIDNDMSAKQGLVFIKRPINYLDNLVRRVRMFKAMNN